MGGGIMLISVMPGLLPAAAIVPVHGAVQLASNSSRVLFGWRHIEWSIFWPFLAGAALGSIVGAGAVIHLNFDYLPLYLGVFVLIVTWVPISKRSFRLPGHFVILGAIQTFFSLFVGVTGPLTNAFLVREELPKDDLVVTHAAAGLEDCRRAGLDGRLDPVREGEEGVRCEHAPLGLVAGLARREVH